MYWMWPVWPCGWMREFVAVLVGPRIVFTLLDYILSLLTGTVKCPLTVIFFYFFGQNFMSLLYLYVKFSTFTFFFVSTTGCSF